VKRTSLMPFIKTVGYTLTSSTEVVVRSMMGKLDLDVGNNIIADWCDKVFRAANVTLEVVGKEKLDGKPAIYMSNHRSSLDVPVVFAAVPPPLRMVGKAELLSIPIWGSAMKTMGFVMVSRGTKQLAIQQLEDAKRRINEGLSIWIAPEGTRSRDGKLGPLKKGGFHLATQLGVRVIPLWIEGTDDVIKPDEFRATLDRVVRVKVGDAIDPRNMSVEELMERVTAQFLAM
jgi:1-acyl-sn-glycerol-3-phosphate acyltransferase